MTIRVYDWGDKHLCDILCRVTDYDLTRNKLYLGTDDPSAKTIFYENLGPFRTDGVVDGVSDIYLNWLEEPNIKMVLQWKSKIDSTELTDDDIDNSDIERRLYKEQLRRIKDGAPVSMKEFTIRLLKPVG